MFEVHYRKISTGEVGFWTALDEAQADVMAEVLNDAGDFDWIGSYPLGQGPPAAN